MSLYSLRLISVIEFIISVVNVYLSVRWTGYFVLSAEDFHISYTFLAKEYLNRFIALTLFTVTYM